MSIKIFWLSPPRKKIIDSGIRAVALTAGRDGPRAALCIPAVLRSIVVVSKAASAVRLLISLR